MIQYIKVLQYIEAYQYVVLQYIEAYQYIANYLTPVSYLLQQHYDTIDCQRYKYNIAIKLSRVV